MAEWLELIEFFLNNIHLIPSIILFILGIVLIIFGGSLIAVRKKSFLLPPNIFEPLTTKERNLYIYGTLMAVFGLVSFFLITGYYGYYWLVDGAYVWRDISK